MNRTLVASLTLSASALVGLAVHEGYRGEAYYATEHEREQKISTIGWGDTQGVNPGDKTTPDKALVRLLASAAVFQQQIKTCFDSDVEMTQNAWDSLVSLAFNIGATAFCKSTLVKKANAGQEFCSEILRWTKQNGKDLPGLVKRRQAEYKTCIKQ
jgi:lysozyme